MDCASPDMTEFSPLYRGVWGPHELKIALAIALLWRMPDRFRHDDDFAKRRRNLLPFQRQEPLPDAVPCPIESIRFDGESIILRDEAAACLGGRTGQGLIHFDSGFNCFIAFDSPADREKFLLHHARRSQPLTRSGRDIGESMTASTEVQ